MSKGVKFIEIVSIMVVTRSRGRVKRELFNGYGVPVLQDEKFWRSVL
jgi:hypothetical protein